MIITGSCSISVEVAFSGNQLTHPRQIGRIILPGVSSVREQIQITDPVQNLTPTFVFKPNVYI